MKLGKRKRKLTKHSKRKRLKPDDSFVTHSTVPVDLSVKSKIIFSSTNSRFQSDFISKLNITLNNFCSPFATSRQNYFLYYQTSESTLYHINGPKKSEDSEEESEALIDEEDDEEEEERKFQYDPENESKKRFNEKIMKGFSESFISLYKLFQQGAIPFFYFVSKPFLNVLFVSKLVNGNKKVNMIARYDPNFHDELVRVLENRSIYYFAKYPSMYVLKMDVYTKIHHFFDYLLNEYIPNVVLNTTFNAQIESAKMPVIYSPAPFLNSINRCVTMTSHHRKAIEKKKKKKKENDNKGPVIQHTIEFKGLIFPHTFNNLLLYLVDKRIPFKVLTETIEDTQVFNLLRVDEQCSQYEDDFWNRHFKLMQKEPLKWKDSRNYRSFLINSDSHKHILMQKYILEMKFTGSAIMLRSKSPKTYQVDEEEKEESLEGDDEEEQEQDNE